MKKILIILSIFFSILIACDDDEKEKINYLGEEIETLFKAFGKCENITDDIYHSVIDSLGRINVLYDQTDVILEKYYTCIDNLKSLSCEKLAQITSIQKLKEVKDCFQYPLITRKQACIYNQTYFCENIFYDCGEEKMEGICQYTLEMKSLDPPRANFNEDRMENYCDSTIDGDQQVVGESDLWDIYKCTLSYRTDCDNFEMVDFRNSEWKKNCSEE